jgi:hypothetical protein
MPLAWTTSTQSAEIEAAGWIKIALGWEPAGGPVVGYVVYTSFNGEAPFAYATVWKVNHAIIAGGVGDSLRVRVSAIDAHWQEGPVSDYSDEIRFVAASDSGGASVPADDPGAENPAGAATPTDDPAPPAPGAPLDFDGDGFSDLLLRNDATGETRIWLVKSGSVVAETPPLAVPLHASIVGNGDYDGDGVADILSMEDASGRLDVQLIRNAEVVAGGTIVEALGAGWKVVGSGDHTGDGRADVLLRNRELGSLQIVFVDGVAASGVAGMYSGIDAGSEVLGSGDYNGDGRADILWSTASGLELWLAGISMDFEIVALTQHDERWEIAATGDYDGDGDSDALLKSGGKLAISAIDGEVLSRPALIGVKLTRSINLPLGDCDGDGAIDLLIQHRPSGESTVENMFYSMSEGLALEARALPDLAEGWTFAAVGQQPAPTR